MRHPQGSVNPQVTVHSLKTEEREYVVGLNCGRIVKVSGLKEVYDVGEIEFEDDAKIWHRIRNPSEVRLTFNW